MDTLYSIIVIILIMLTFIFIILHTEGYWIIKSREIIKSDTYDVSYYCNISHNKIPSGKETKEVHKITYYNNRVRYVTKTFRH